MTMSIMENDFVLQIATVNGSGSQSANLILVRTLFRMGIPVGGKNLFPSNIQGLPTWFTIRAHPKGFVSRRPQQDIVITLNSSTAKADQAALRPGGLFLHSTDCKLGEQDLRQDVVAIAVPFRELVAQASDSVKTKKLLANMIYVGILAELMNLDRRILSQTIEDQYSHKAELVAANQKAVDIGFAWAKENNSQFPQVPQAKFVPNGNAGQILIDGNTSAGMGLVAGGCTVGAWYPITPSSSLMEGFIRYAEHWRKDKKDHSKVAIVQAEDELAAICMVLGAGWAGARAATATSGPGLSLMAEAAGLAYFAEIPSVIWDVQRVGPSTGLPTRTMQGDVTFAATLSHGDTRHVLLFPANPSECFEFGQTAFDLAEQLQTLVIVMSDLDLGMNLHRTKEWQLSDTPFQRGKVLSQADLEKLGSFARYKDASGDGVGPRTLPGTRHPEAAYFTRGTGHDELSRYSEDPTVFKHNMDRLLRKWETAKTLVPKPEIIRKSDSKIGLIAYGTTDAAIPELCHILSQSGSNPNYLRLKAYPFTAEVEEFINQHEKLYVVEQNRDGQMRGLLCEAFSLAASKFHSVLTYDGWPVAPEEIAQKISQMENRI